MAQIIQFPTKAKEVVSRQIPQQLIKKRKGGGNKLLSYISGSTVIDLLNEAFGYLWSWNIQKQWIQESQPKKKYQSEELEPQGPVAHVRGVLTVFLIMDNNEIIHISKSGLGSKSILGGQNDQESIFKAASTDALKKAASLFGIGAQLYRDEDEQAFFDAINYEDPWTEETLIQFEPERDYIKSIMKTNNASNEDMAEIIVEWSQGVCQNIDDLTPDNITDFVNYLKNLQNASVSA